MEPSDFKDIKPGANPYRQIVLSDFLTDQQIQQAWELAEACGIRSGEFARRCEQEVIVPNIRVIETKLGQQCDSRYLAYCVEYVFLEAIYGNEARNKK